MSRLFTLLIAILFSLANRESCGEEVAAAELSERVSAANQAIKNASFKVTWKDSIDGTLRQYSVVKIVYDSLGRIRMTEIDKGFYDKAGGQVSSRKGRKDSSFDGEKSVVMNTNTDFDASDKPIDPHQDEVVRNAVIADAMDDAGKWRTATRNPLRNNSRHLVVRLDALARLGQTIALSPIQYAGEEAVVARFQQGGVDVTATLDPKRSWALRDLIEKDSMGTITKHYHAEYAQSKEGLWLPFLGTTMFLHEKMEPPVVKPPKVKGGKPEVVRARGKAPIMQKEEWVFELSDLVINDPRFDESVFTIFLPTGTLVSDLRFKTAYRIGEAKATDAELRRLASFARDNPESIRKAISPSRKASPHEDTPSSTSSLMWMIFGALVLGVLLVCAGVGARRTFFK